MLSGPWSVCPSCLCSSVFLLQGVGDPGVGDGSSCVHTGHGEMASWKSCFSEAAMLLLQAQSIQGERKPIWRPAPASCWEGGRVQAGGDDSGSKSKTHPGHTQKAALLRQLCQCGGLEASAVAQRARRGELKREAAARTWRRRRNRSWLACWFLRG